ncbi:hypothetical protein [Methyloferula stellata]|uniref:hypothetical protein n=1 Tax=Methyloferula stellata TaxID=876270 RepID=UPI000366E3DB|nr:hypothetical protein [Methyloferula stellata]
MAFEAAACHRFSRPREHTTALALQPFATHVAKAMSFGKGTNARSGRVEAGRLDELARDINKSTFGLKTGVHFFAGALIRLETHQE